MGLSESVGFSDGDFDSDGNSEGFSDGALLGVCEIDGGIEVEGLSEGC